VRKILLGVTFTLTATGILVWFSPSSEARGVAQKIFALAHIWLGVAYLVVFPLYAWDHVSKNRHWLTAWRSLTASGVLQLTSGALILQTGLVLLLYGGAFVLGLRSLHFWLTFPLVAGLAWHYLSPKRWEGPAKADPS